MAKQQPAKPDNQRGRTTRSVILLIIFVGFCIAYAWHVLPMLFGSGGKKQAAKPAPAAARPADANYGTDGEPVSAMA